MLDRLVTVSVVTHVHDLHFADFMDHLTVIAVVEQRRNGKYGVEHHNERIFTTHQVDQSLRIVENRPSIMPAVSFCKGIPPFQRRERSLESTVGILATHQLGFLIVQVLIVHGTFSVQLKFFFRTA